MEVVVRVGEREEKVTVRRAGPPAGGYVVTVGDRTYRVDSAPAGGALSLRLTEGDGPAGDQHEVSVRPLALAGAGFYQIGTAAGSVKAGDGVIVLEAMKMQNEIQAEHDGRITRIHVQPGQAVEGGDPLFDLE